MIRKSLHVVVACQTRSAPLGSIEEVNRRRLDELDSFICVPTIADALDEGLISSVNY